MACSWTGLLAIFLSAAALVLATVGLAMPFWSSTVDSTRLASASAYKNVQFTTGVWGFCVNADLNISSDHVQLDQCFSFYRATDLSEAIKVNGSMTSNPYYTLGITAGVCSTYQDANSSAFNLGAKYAGLGNAPFKEFMDKSCGAIGKASLAFATLAMGFGLLSVTTLVFFVTCCGARSCYMTLAKTFTLLACVSSLIAFCCWTGQVHSLGGAIGYGASFGLEIASFVLSFVALLAIIYHQAYARKNQPFETNVKV
ncbi:hypothetical protein ACHHYP_00842 [Achlya hypogyna]|uniref:Uncharacterized protein n=1 Tax=Achlya hypogyna TaxID=1202772 RepID=A0A1V9ZA57_ACHHY|nr:hypothetical protein ACHHYP_00842 [Achlya hypogyna]